MKHYVKVEGGVVVNRIVFEGAIPQGWAGAAAWIANDEAQIGWSYDGSTFAPPPEPPARPPTAEEQRAAVFKADPERQDLLTRLSTATPAQIEAYVDAQATTVAGVRKLLKQAFKLIALDNRN